MIIPGPGLFLQPAISYIPPIKLNFLTFERNALPNPPFGNDGPSANNDVVPTLSAE